MYIQYGDFHYWNINTNNQALFNIAIDDQHSMIKRKKLFLSMGMDSVWDDHDYGPNNASSTSPSKPAAVAIYRLLYPNYTLPDSSAVYHSFVIGRCRFVLSDLRSERDPNGNPDGPTHTMMSPTQLAWFENEILTAKNLGQLVFWMSTVPWNAPAGDNNGDDWGGFINQKTQIINYIASISMQQQIIICTGDMHAAAIDNGTNANGFVNFAPFPENQTSQLYGGGFTQGPITHAGTRIMGFGGIITVTDSGGPTINVKLDVINEVGIQLSYQQNFPIASTTQKKIFITHNIDVIDFSAFPEKARSFNI
jgi:alkaline phosphatase D